MCQGAKDGFSLSSREFVEPVPWFQFFHVFGLLLGGYLNRLRYEVPKKTQIGEKGVEQLCLGVFPWPAEGLCDGVDGVDVVGV